MPLSEKLKAEISRKVFHFGVVAGHLFIISFINFWLGFALLVLGLMVVYIFRHSKLSKFVDSTRKHSLGQYYLFIGLIIVNIFYLFLKNDLALYFSYFALGFSDVLAGFIPYFMPQKVDTSGHVIVSTKSLVYGSILFTILNIIFLSIFKFPLSKVVIISILLSIIEFYSRKGTDNLTVPVFGYFVVLLTV